MSLWDYFFLFFYVPFQQKVSLIPGFLTVFPEDKVLLSREHLCIRLDRKGYPYVSAYNRPGSYGHFSP